MPALTSACGKKAVLDLRISACDPFRTFTAPDITSAVERRKQTEPQWKSVELTYINKREVPLLQYFLQRFPSEREQKKVRENSLTIRFGFGTDGDRKLTMSVTRLAFPALGLGVGLLLCLPTTLNAADSGKQAAARGKAILQENCGRCHAIEAVGKSPLKEAPPMRDVYVQFDLRELEARLSEGIGSAHKEMPQIQFSDEDVYAIASYLYALAVSK